ncbi:MAG TPA: LLM class flavin-dependent oxidoreductase [Verrucomicrobiae bacterium]|jgi:5,10-methylenetetrahydromethanopterin reductase|nr:LLM class flavin-dependent oxidoreductase [Verrucomicrobiae bacterium]
MELHLHGSARTIGQALERARAAEAAGFDGIFFADSQLNSLDPFQVLSLIATRTTRLRLGTAVSNMVYRDPSVLANSAATANEISDGRVILGLGTGDGPVYSLGRHATKLAEFERGLETIHDLLAGKHIAVPRGKERAEGRVRLRVGKLPVPLYISAEGPKTLRAAGRAADGVILGSGFDLKVLAWARERIAEGAREAHRDPSAIDVMPAGMTVVGQHGPDARSLVRARLANRAHHNFRFTMETVPADEVAGVDRFMRGFDISKPIEERIDPELVSDYLVRRFTIAGTADECAERVRELAAAGVERLLLTPPEAIYLEVVEAWGRDVIPRL